MRRSRARASGTIAKWPDVEFIYFLYRVANSPLHDLAAYVFVYVWMYTRMYLCM